MSRDFPGTNSNYLSMGDAASVDVTGLSFSVSSWVKPDAISGVNRSIIGKDTTGVLVQYRLGTGIGTNKWSIQCGDGGTEDTVDGALNPALGVWSHVAAVKNSVDLRLYVNGALDGTPLATTRAIYDSASPCYIGNRLPNDQPWDGLIEHVAIWDASLTPDEILSLAKGTSPRMIRPLNLRGYWPLRGLALPEPDLSGRGAPGVLTGSIAVGAPGSPQGPYVLS